jgi:SpoVK/Ycf46/Vps4 family AAA+-type ATPase
MHTDEKSCVNELLVQLDRVLRAGRLVVGTTNFVRSMDDAALRSGRFGQFIPVPPPNLGESIEIVGCYLHRLEAHSDQNARIIVKIPDTDSLEPIVGPIYRRNLESGSLFCGADLEEAVNRAYVRCARNSLPRDPLSHESESMTVHLTDQELARSLNEVPRSIQQDAREQFIADVDQFCDRETVELLRGRLEPESKE